MLRALALCPSEHFGFFIKTWFPLATHNEHDQSHDKNHKHILYLRCGRNTNTLVLLKFCLRRIAQENR